MSQCTIDVKIGCDGKEASESYKTLEVSFDFSFEKLGRLCNEMCTTLARTPIPLFIVEHPNLLCTPFHFSQNNEQGSHKANGKLYSWANPKEGKFYKNIDRQFQQINKLQNNCWAKLKVYDPQNNHSLDRCHLKAAVALDKQITNVLTDILRRISVQFLNSPVMALLQILQTANFQIEYDAFATLPQSTRKLILSWLSIETWLTPQNIAQIQADKGQYVFYFTLSKVCMIKVKVDSAVVGYLHRVCKQ